MTQAQVIKLLKKAQGGNSLREFCREIGCSPAYLSDIYKGRREPGQLVLDHIGIVKTVETKRIVTYRKAKG